MEYFYSALEATVRSAKRNGLFDIGIKNFSGREVSFTGPPRTFHFQGDRNIVQFYEVKCDTGITSKMAKHEYEEATVNVKTSKRIRSGFYIDDRDYLRKQPDSLGRKVFLIIFAGNFADKVLVRFLLIQYFAVN